ncbi:glycosyltransferase [Thalassoglobus sp.]|uniref:glycosyltransferase n=1 Tax=Thalassoglobus sp. TaxID=2795869 RepID=UPI003AA818CD
MLASSQLEMATQQACAGLLLDAQHEFQELLKKTQTPSSLLLNNLAVVEASLGNFESAQHLLAQAAELDPQSTSVTENRCYLERYSSNVEEGSFSGQTTITSEDQRRRIAIVSLLFNWPSTGGGTVHTKELADFLQHEGYEVRHFYAVNEQWSVGNVRDDLPYPSTPIPFSEQDWNADSIRKRFHDEVTNFSPDAVIVTDSWNTKPLLCEAVADFPYFIRIAALESLCPLNNVRLLVDDQNQPQQCALNQLAEPTTCRNCVIQNQHLSGGLHQADRQLGGFFEADYPERLQRAFAMAEGVLAVNPEIASLFEPHCKTAYVIPSGFDEQRFPAEAVSHPPQREKKRLLFAGLTNELMKGFHVLQQAGELLWQQRQDFEIVATADPVGQTNEFTRFIGWLSQASLPEVIRDSDFLVFPTIAQEALGRTAVEAMGCGRPVIASDIGGLSWVVEHGVTGLLCEAGNPHDLAAKCSQLLDAHSSRIQFGINGRKKFERDFTWKQIIKKHYLQLFGTPVREAARV